MSKNVDQHKIYVDEQIKVFKDFCSFFWELMEKYKNNCLHSPEAPINIKDEENYSWKIGVLACGLGKTYREVWVLGLGIKKDSKIAKFLKMRIKDNTDIDNLPFFVPTEVKKIIDDLLKDLLPIYIYRTVVDEKKHIKTKGLVKIDKKELEYLRKKFFEELEAYRDN